MQRITVLSVVSLFAFAACADDPKRAAPTEPAVPSAPSLSVAGEVAPPTMKSTTCLAFELRRDEAAAAGDSAAAADYDAAVSKKCK